MSFRNQLGIYQVLERLLKTSDRPLTCVDLYDSAEVKKYADDANRVSDYLGHMFRKGLLKRTAAPKSGASMARWAYSWKDMKLGSPVARIPQPRLVVVPTKPGTEKPNVEIAQDGDTIVVDMPGFTLTVRAK